MPYVTPEARSFVFLSPSPTHRHLYSGFHVDLLTPCRPGAAVAMPPIVSARTCAIAPPHSETDGSTCSTHPRSRRRRREYMAQRRLCRASALSRADVEEEYPLRDNAHAQFIRHFLHVRREYWHPRPPRFRPSIFPLPPSTITAAAHSLRPRRRYTPWIGPAYRS